MAQQSYQNHAHRPTATIVGYVFVLVALTGFALRWAGGGRAAFAVGLLGLVGAITVLLAISRLYITRLQDRIIKLEMRIRCQGVLPPGGLQQFEQLSTKQIVALRFASDGELPALLERVVRERLAPRDIKRAITAWRPDLDRT